MAQILSDFDTYGYAVLHDAVPAEDVAAMRRELMPLLECQPGYTDELFVNRQGLLNDHPAFDALLRSPGHHAIARHMFGTGEGAYKYGGSGVVLAKPGTTKSAGYHSDVPYNAFGGVQPDAPLMLNSIYALTDFSTQTGATKLVPLSHHARRGPPARAEGQGLRHAISVEMRAGSVLVFHGRLWHTTGDNTSEEARLGVSVVWCHPHLDCVSCGWDPLRPDVIARQPAALRPRLLHKRGVPRRPEQRALRVVTRLRDEPPSAAQRDERGHAVVNSTAAVEVG
jgi:hypothetical protein